MSEADGTNVIFILTDDQGPWAVGCAGNPEIRTPNLDRLATSGIRFESFFCASPVSSPARASLMTGRIPSQHGVHDWIRGGNTPPDAIEYLQGLTCYTDVLAARGYTCGISGKWHLGDSVKPQAGFGFWFVHQKGGGPYNDAPMVRDGKLVTEPGYVSDVITDEAVRFLDTVGANAAKGATAGSPKPFCLSVHYTAPHSPWTGHPQDIVDSYDDCPFESCPQEEMHPWAGGLTKSCLGNREMLKGYFAAVTAMDAGVGRIIDRVEELGLREKTLIVFTSDNGFSCGHHGFWGKGNGTRPLNMYENSVKVPMILSHPGRIAPGRVTSAMASAYDFMPTLLEYVGADAPDDPSLPGTSFASVLEQDRAAPSEPPNLPFRPAEGGAGSRRRRRTVVREDVVVYDEYGPVRMVRTRDWKYVARYPDGPDELYDLANDPGERDNLVDDPARRARVGEMRDRLEEWFARYVDPARDGRLQPVSGGGQQRMVASPSDDGAFFPRDG